MLDAHVNADTVPFLAYPSPFVAPVNPHALRTELSSPAMPTFLGQFAGIGTSLCWTLTSVLFTEASKRIGPTAVNGVRIVVALVLLTLTHRLLSGAWLPNVIWRQVALLALSGVIGLSIGDQALFTAFVDIGPRQATLIMTTAPIFAASFGWAAMGETLPPPAWIGIGLTVAGVAWVVLERPRRRSRHESPNRVRGTLLAFLAAACQAGGLMLSKLGMGHGWLDRSEHLDPQTATMVRMVFAAVGMTPILLLHALRERRRHALGIAARHCGPWSKGLLLTCGGAICGPFLGVWLSLIASDHAPVGVAQTLCSLVPIFILPVVILGYKERVSPRAAIGALLAVGGVALLFTPSG